MKKLRKIEAMHHFYGKDPQERKCAECEHLIHGYYHDRPLYKCTVYGCTHSEASDWRKSYNACALIDRPFPEDDKRIIDVLRRNPVRKVEQVPGQLDLFNPC